MCGRVEPRRGGHISELKSENDSPATAAIAAFSHYTLFGIALKIFRISAREYPLHPSSAATTRPPTTPAGHRFVDSRHSFILGYYPFSAVSAAGDLPPQPQMIFTRHSASLFIHPSGTPPSCADDFTSFTQIRRCEILSTIASFLMSYKPPTGRLQCILIEEVCMTIQGRYLCKV
ncbi:hypothetical protein V9T40_000897 [Parthenolecanium corni]|uniref:Uncharacterized protein n=1 Tax=Parthenolecanium corni TaxID=536013 RepID=A0AAN9TA74_9HEMI